MDCKTFKSAMIDDLSADPNGVLGVDARDHAANCTPCRALLEGLSTRRLASVLLAPTQAKAKGNLLATANTSADVPARRRRWGGIISLAGSWAMRPQTAMAAVFLVMLATSGLLLRGKSARTPASAEVIVTERGAPAPSVTAMSFGSEPRPPAAAHRVATLAETRPTGSGGVGNELSARPVATKDATSAGARDEDNAHSLRTPAPGAQLADSTDRVSAGGAAARGYDATAGEPASTFEAALSAYRAGRYDEATGAFDALAPLDGNAELWAARSAREANGCLGALARFDGLAQSARDTPPGWDALLEGALCHRAIGDFSKARAELDALLGVDSHKDRATAELERLDQMQQARSDEPPRHGKGGTKSAHASPTANHTDASR